jgi:creatinine amidohydrolase
MKFAELTKDEIAALPRSLTVVIPTAATEQHGPHLPVDADTRILDALVSRLDAERGTEILAAPTLWLGHSPHHLAFGGTLSVDYRSHAQILVSLAACFIGMGFGKILFLNSHGGNGISIANALQDLKAAYPNAKIFACSYYEAAAAGIAALRESGFGGMGHACELETSLYLYIDEKAVRRDKIADGGRAGGCEYLRGEMYAKPRLAYAANFDEFTENGVNGAAALATAKKGEAFFAASVSALEGILDAIRDITDIFL